MHMNWEKHLNTSEEMRLPICSSETVQSALASKTIPVTPQNRQLREGHWSRHGEASKTCTTIDVLASRCQPRLAKRTQVA